MRWPGIEPGSNAWKASMLTITPPTLEGIDSKINLENRDTVASMISHIINMKNYISFIY